MISRAEFKLIAEVLKSTRPANYPYCDPWLRGQWDHTCQALVKVFQHQNGLFDTDRFLAASGWETPK